MFKCSQSLKKKKKHLQIEQSCRVSLLNWCHKETLPVNRLWNPKDQD